MSKLLNGKIALVTGGNAGIGKAIALRLAEQGAIVNILGRNQQTGDAVVDEIKAAGGEGYFFSVDVADTAAVKAQVEALLGKFGKVDLLVNNAGITRDSLLMKMDEESWDAVLDTNLKSAYNTCSALVRSMIKARAGKIINISSVVGLTGNAGQAHYAASKSGLIGFSKSLARELAGRGICVNCVAPGFIQTAMTDVLTDAQKEMILKSIPLGRMGRAEEIADAVVFLASDAANYITGQTITVDGGMVM